ncbi:MAG: cytotoxic translational repressor of toxin-antitoxin stability system [Gammaproteobacteria bacterium]|nr:MAG: cytotoxic translational repressor of toxin-antitoxin stability system [Gammaproteobacteria bacterium]
MNQVKWGNKAQKQLVKIKKGNPKAANKIIVATRGLESFPNTSNTKQLTNHKHDFRLRVGEYRVLFDFDGQLKIVEVKKVGVRDDKTYN